MRNTSTAQRFLALLLAVALLLGLTGCRQSAAFTQIIYNQDFEDQVDDDQLIDNQPENEEEEDMFSVAEEEDADTDRGFDESESAYDSTAEDDTSAANASYQDTAQDNGNSTQGSGGSSDTNTSGTTSGTSDDGAEEGGNDTSDEDGDGGTITPGLTDDDQQGKDDQNTDPDEDENQQQDDDTQPQLISSDIVFATGNAALLVQMLGGEGVLAGCDSSTLTAMQGYFPGGELSGITAIWQGTGSGTLLTDVIAKMEYLPQYLLYDTTSTSAASINALKAMGITCIELDFRYATGILNAVETVKEILGTDYASTMAEKYTAFYSSITSTLAGSIGTYTSGKSYDCKYQSTSVPSGTSTCTDGKSTLFIADWDDAASVKYYTSAFTKTFSGMAVTNISFTNTPISYYMSIAGVENMAAAAATGTGSKTCYLTTFSWTLSSITLSKGSLSSNLDYANGYYLASGLGGSSYPALVVASNAIKSKIEASELWQVCSYDSHGGNSRVYIFQDSSEAISQISGSYEIYVNPNGLGNWMTGSPESILESAWIAWKFHDGDAYSESDVRSLIAEYYQTFYRCTLTDSQISAILAGD